MTGLQVQLRSTSPIRLEAEFDCGAGELVALVGPSGSGKTSMLRAIAGLWTPADVQGHIRVAGQAWLDTALGVQLSARSGAGLPSRPGRTRRFMIFSVTMNTRLFEIGSTSEALPKLTSCA